MITIRKIMTATTAIRIWQ